MAIFHLACKKSSLEYIQDKIKAGEKYCKGLTTVTGAGYNGHDDRIVTPVFTQIALTI
jgi:hypothetical protein